jgi:hypothetical protein
MFDNYIFDNPEKIRQFLNLPITDITDGVGIHKECSVITPLTSEDYYEDIKDWILETNYVEDANDSNIDSLMDWMSNNADPTIMGRAFLDWEKHSINKIANWILIDNRVTVTNDRLKSDLKFHLYPGEISFLNKKIRKSYDYFINKIIKQEVDNLVKSNKKTNKQNISINNQDLLEKVSTIRLIDHKTPKDQEERGVISQNLENIKNNIKRELKRMIWVSYSDRIEQETDRYGIEYPSHDLVIKKGNGDTERVNEFQSDILVNTNSKRKLLCVTVKNNINQNHYLQILTTFEEDISKIYSGNDVLDLVDIVDIVEFDSSFTLAIQFSLLRKYRPGNYIATNKFDEFDRFNGFKELVPLKNKSSITNDINFISKNYDDVLRIFRKKKKITKKKMSN